MRGSAESTHLAISTSLEPTTNWTQRLGQVQDHLAEIKSNRVPTCKRLAAQGLVYSCEKYDATDASATHNTQAELEAFPKLYAIRMTQCALEDAGSSLPSVCKAAQSPLPGRPVGESDIQTCLSALIQNTNTWTTYSHMNTDGLIMCQAMRVEQSKDEQLHFFQVLLGTTSDISEAMRAIKGDIDQLFSKIGNEMHTFHMELQKDNLESKAAIKENLDGIQANMNGVSGDVRGLLVAMGEAKQTIHEYTTQFDSALSRAQDWSTQMDNGWATSLTKIRDDFEETRNFYQYQLERYHADFAQRAYAMTNDLETVNSLSSDLLSKLALLNEDLDEPLEKVGVLASQADVVKEKQSAMMAEFKEKGDSILVSLAAASEHAVFVNTWMGAAVGLFLDFRADIKLNLLIFSICYPVAGPVVFMGCRQAFGLVAGNLVTLFASFGMYIHRLQQNNANQPYSFSIVADVFPEAFCALQCSHRQPSCSFQRSTAISQHTGHFHDWRVHGDTCAEIAPLSTSIRSCCSIRHSSSFSRRSRSRRAEAVPRYLSHYQD